MISGGLWLLEKSREKMIVRGPALLYDISNHKPLVAKNGTYLEIMHLRKITKTPVFIIFKGPFAIIV